MRRRICNHSLGCTASVNKSSMYQLIDFVFPYFSIAAILNLLASARVGLVHRRADLVESFS